MKIGFCGTMSVGKSTLVNALKELPEFKDYTFRISLNALLGHDHAHVNIRRMFHYNKMII